MEQAFIDKLKKATEAASKDPHIVDIAGRVAYVSGYMSRDYPEISDLLWQIHSPGFGKVYG